ncbi:MAG: dTDP-4-dehydrorhamnose 3,5-epimerase [Bacteroidia bacterium]|nr:MAG: dTDP-4-dehydrorhamnose 3,5-epimerase [Bacteroidia bacterium]
MKAEAQRIPEVLLITPTVHRDHRGYFYESYQQEHFARLGIKEPFVQDNQSQSTYGVIRGLHYQLAPHAQGKLVRAIEGTILDVAVDIRPLSRTYSKSVCVELSAENHQVLYIPRGFAHGFVVLSERAIVSYKCDAYWNPDAERGIRYDDPALQIDWRIPEGDIVLSSRDSLFPSLSQADVL